MRLYDEIQIIKELYVASKSTWTKVSDEFVDHFLGVVPPIYFCGGFACGEEYSIDAFGDTLYFCIVQNHCRICTIFEAESFAKKC